MKSNNVFGTIIVVLLLMTFINSTNPAVWIGNDIINTRLTDSAGNTNFIGTFGEQIAGTQFDDISVQFQYELDTQFDVKPPVIVGDGNVSVSNSLLRLSSNIGNTSISSRDSIRYRPGHTALIKYTASFSGTGVGYAGAFDDQDGIFIKVDNGVMSFGYRNGGVDTETTQSSFNGEYDVSNLDFTKINIFLIKFGYLGVADPSLWVFAPNGSGWQLLHSEYTAGNLVDTHVGNPVFPITFSTIGDMTLTSGSWNGGVVGESNNIGSRGFIFPNTPLVSGVGTNAGEMTLSGTTVGNVVTFHSKSFFQGKNNKIKARLKSYEFTVDTPSGNVVGGVLFQIVGNPTLNATPNYISINNASSVMEYDHTAGTGASVSYVGGGVVILETVVNYVGSNKGGVSLTSSLDAESIGAFAYANETFSIIAKDYAGNNVNVRVVLNWEELF